MMLLHFVGSGVSPAPEVLRVLFRWGFLFGGVGGVMRPAVVRADLGCLPNDTGLLVAGRGVLRTSRGQAEFNQGGPAVRWLRTIGQTLGG